MTRKYFLADLALAKQLPPAHVAGLDLYDDQGFSFTYHYYQGKAERKVIINSTTIQIENYPHGSSYLLWSDDGDGRIGKTLERMQNALRGLRLSAILTRICDALYQLSSLDSVGNPIVTEGDDIELRSTEQDGAEDRDSNFDPDDCEYESDDIFEPAEHDKPRSTLSAEKLHHQLNAISLQSIKSDLHAVKAAGFKVGVIRDLRRDGILCVSIRIAKLGISEETMHAWTLSRNKYLVLLLRFPQGYISLRNALDGGTLDGRTEMQVALCDSYKPACEEAYNAFTRNRADEDGTRSRPLDLTLSESLPKLEPVFIGRPLYNVLNERFIRIVKFRSFGVSWDGAERWFNDAQGHTGRDITTDGLKYSAFNDDTESRALPQIVKEDTLAINGVERASLPLVAMQFLLRHFVRCVEFCLVCHCKVEETFGALKPFVCSRPLCLFQFFQMGFGPSIEWEIMSQPYVVDLLISLCYTQARSHKLQDMPMGIDLRVPLLPQYKDASSVPMPYYPQNQSPGDTNEATPDINEGFEADLQDGGKVLVLDEQSGNKEMQANGQWIVIVSSRLHQPLHCRVRNVSARKIFLDQQAMFRSISPADAPKMHVMSGKVKCYLYDQSFDVLPRRYRCEAILAVLESLPSIREMRAQLKEQQDLYHDMSLSKLIGVSPTARDLLRWIIASNRSCIMQVDNVAATSHTEAAQASEPRVVGMSDWMQFRFAQGAPDKEQRFIDCVDKHSANKQYPTLFAWHGSPLHNWHSIIRQGLNFKEIAHGRASGNGVYMSTQLSVSLGYCGSRFASPRLSENYWPQSELKITSMISLQEVVNAPLTFVSRTPHFVVAQEDWIQTRYLFVKTPLKHSVDGPMSDIYDQDPAYPLTNNGSQKIEIPITAVSKSRRLTVTAMSSLENKKRKRLAELSDEEIEMECASVTTTDEDREIADLDDISNLDVMDISDDESAIVESTKHPMTAPQSPSNGRKRKGDYLGYILDGSKTDFIPGHLDMHDIKILPAPEDATPGATKTLMLALQEALGTQEKTPLHELGYYIDRDNISNIYQWIIELHSFDQDLLLAKDMRNSGVRSIVLEMIFTADFPYSPPFVRVVKPRFLPFVQGGGGHVTEGGAICMELLTSTGWSAIISIESVLLQIKLAMSEKERPARLLSHINHISRMSFMGGGTNNSCYAIGEALQAYQRACAKHNWTVPKSFQNLTKRF